MAVTKNVKGVVNKSINETKWNHKKILNLSKRKEKTIKKQQGSRF